MQNLVTNGTAVPEQPLPPSRLADLLAGALVAILSTLLVFNGLDTEPHFADESAMIAQSYYYRLLKEGQWNHPDWLHYAAYDHPPLPKYLFGASLDWAGLPTPTSITAWLNWIRGDFSPPKDHRILYWARVPSALFGMAGVVGLYFLGLQLRNRLIGLLAAAFLVVNPLYLTHARRAMSDSFAESLVILSVVVAVAGQKWGLKRDHKNRWTFWVAGYILVQCVVCGSAALAKLNGGIATVIALAIVTGGWLVRVFYRMRGESCAIAPHTSITTIAPMIALAIACGSFLVFTMLNPFMTARPALDATAPAPTRALAEMGIAGRAQFLVQFRRDWARDALANEMFQKDWLQTFSKRVRMTVWEGFGRYSPLGPRDIRTREPRPETERFVEYGRPRAFVWLPLVCIGLIVAIAGGWRDLQANRPPLAWCLVLYAAVSLAIVVFMIPLNWDRYYLPLQAPAALLAAMGVGSLLSYGTKRIGALGKGAVSR